MGYFQIDFNKFKPSSKTPTGSASPTVQTRLETNLQRLAPQQSPQGTPPPSPTAPMPQPQVQEQKKTGMGRVFDLLNKPSEWVQSKLTGGKTYEEAFSDKNSGFSKFNEFAYKANPLRLIPGVAKKQDENYQKAMESDTAKKVGGAAWRMVADPLNFLPFGKIGGLIGKGVSKIDDVLKLSKFGDKIMDTARATPAIYKTIEKINPYFRNPEFGKVLRESEGITSKRLNDLYGLIKTTAKNMSPKAQRRIGAILEGGVDTSAKYEKLAAPLRSLTDKIGKEAVDLGILSRKSFNKYKGAYMKHIFEKYLDVAQQNGYIKRVAPGIGSQFNKMRKGVEGYVKEFSAPTFAGLGSGIKDIEAARFYKKIASDFGSGVEIIKNGRKIAQRIVPDGFQYAPHAIKNSKVAKFFKNKALPNSIIDYINKTSEVNKLTSFDKVYGAWKAGKTIWNPAYHARNLMSNQILSDMSTGKGLVRTAMDYIGAVRQYAGKGSQKFVEAAQNAGLIKQKRFGAAIDEFLDMSDVAPKFSGNKVIRFFQKYDAKTRNLQNITEDTSKLNVFKSWVEKLATKAGKSVDDALKDPEILKNAASKAEEAIFSPYRIPQAERAAIGKLIPFYSFTRQVVPFTAKTLIKNPARIAKYAKTKREIENFSKGEPRPGYAENFIRLPFKNDQGEPMYLDPTYIYPFGNVFEGGSRGRLPFGLGFNPLLTEGAQQIANKDFYFDQPITKYESENMSGENIKARVGHAARTISPQFPANVVSKVIPAVTGKEDNSGRKRGVVQALADTFAGIKTQYIGAQKGVLDQFYKGKVNIRSKQNDIKKILNDNSLSETEKRRMIQKILQ